MVNYNMSGSNAKQNRKKIKKISAAEYVRRKRILSKYMMFSFRTLKNFTPSQRAAITKGWNKYFKYIRSVEAKTSKFVPVKPTRLRYIKRDFVHTNKGIFYYDKTKKYSSKTRVIGKGKNTRLVTYWPHRKEVFVPLPRGTDFLTFVVGILDSGEKFDEISLAIQGAHGRQRYSPKAMRIYLKRDIENYIKSYGNKNKSHPFNGVYLTKYI